MDDILLQAQVRSVRRQAWLDILYDEYYRGSVYASSLIYCKANRQRQGRPLYT